MTQGRKVYVWRNPTPMFLTGADGSRKSWQWAIRIGLSMDGCCAGFVQHLTVPLPFHGDLPGSPCRPPVEVFEAVEHLIATMGTDRLTVIEPTTAASSPAAHALRNAMAAVAEPLALAEAARDKAESKRADAEAEVTRLEGVEQEQAGRIDALTQRVHELEMSTAGQQETIHDKTAAATRLEAQLAEAQSALAARDQELAGLTASAKTVEGLQGQLEALQRSV